ncbi:MAG: DMT family transporter [Actinobacteria bacterium]|nr:DMT family transporter [Actinomycetota bacterium]
MSTPDRHGRLATVLLLIVTAAWGSTFFLIKDLVVTVPPTDFLAVRFTIAAVAMFALFHRQVRRLTPRDLRLGLVLGLLYGSAQVLQTMGLQHTDASISGFITGTYVVLTPVLGALLLRDRIPPMAWFAVLLATIGLAVLSLRGLAIGTGELQTLIAAAIYALHILALGRWSTSETAVGLATVQAAVIAAVCLLAALPGGITLPQGGGQWASMLYMALVAGAFALWAQTWAQAHVTATRAAITMAMEPVFAALFAVLFGGESLTGRMLVGGALVLVATYLVELRPRRRPEATALEDPPAEALHHEA